MARSLLQEEIISYIDHLEDEGYWRTILGGRSCAEIVDALYGLLDAESEEAMSDACLFICDLILVAPDCEGREEFRRRFHSSPLIPRLERLVEAPSLSKRCLAVHTLGKTCARQSVEFLRQVFVRRKETDPLLLTDLGFEINWLAQRLDVDWYVRQCFNSSFPTTRWAGLEILGNCDVDPDEIGEWAKKRAAVLSLCDDPDLRVRAVARFMRDTMNVSPIYHPEKERLDNFEKFYGLEPLRLDIAAIGFRNKMQQEGRIDYQCEEFTAYLETAFPVATDG